jgi:hypothetical protein
VTRPAADPKALKIVDEFFTTGFDNEDEAKAWLAKKITAALEEAEGPVIRGRCASGSNIRGGSNGSTPFPLCAPR